MMESPRWGWETFFVPQARDYEGHDGVASRKGAAPLRDKIGDE